MFDFIKNNRDFWCRRLLRGQEKYRRQIHLGQKPWSSSHTSRSSVRVQYNDFSSKLLQTEICQVLQVFYKNFEQLGSTEIGRS